MTRALLTATALLVMTAGCSGSAGNHDAGPGSGGVGGSGAGGAPAAVHCSPLNINSTDCFCSSLGSGSLPECSPDSVASTDHGYCCSGGGFCNCWRIACVSLPSIGYCKCGTPIDDTSMRVDSCPQPSGGTCCLDTGHVPYVCSCIGSVTGCLAGETQVASCALADVMKCAATETVVARCK
jgi:hypothetical protein